MVEEAKPQEGVIESFAAHLSFTAHLQAFYQALPAEEKPFMEALGTFARRHWDIISARMSRSAAEKDDVHGYEITYDPGNGHYAFASLGTIGMNVSNVVTANATAATPHH